MKVFKLSTYYIPLSLTHIFNVFISGGIFPKRCNFKQYIKIIAVIKLEI